MTSRAEQDLRILTGPEVLDCLRGQELAVVGRVEAAYRAHGEGHSSLPHSVFLRFPAKPRDRIIALPAFLGEGFALAGVKWVASFPENLERGLNRASAAMILNSVETGQPVAVLEGSIVSARRTAASAALAARVLLGSGPTGRLAMVGCGPINFEIARFLRAVLGDLGRVVVYDLEPSNAARFASRLGEVLGTAAAAAPDLSSALEGAGLVSFATTAGEPYLSAWPGLAPGAVVLHISLRDLSPELLLGSDNVVDDIDHVCRERTSVHLAELRVGHRRFVRCSLADILLGREPARRDLAVPVVFSPFGLGILDLAVADLAMERAQQQDRGTLLGAFLPPPWVDWD